jgi:DNA mismatch repair ATPase MutS
VEQATEDLELLSGILLLQEKGKFSSPKLVELQNSLKRNGVTPSAAIKRLARLAEFLKQRRNPVAKPLDVVLFWSAQVVFAAERWQQEFGPQIRGWLAAVGELEALTALSAYAYEHPADVLPEFVGEASVFDAEGLAHPLLPVSKAIRNDVKLGDGLQLMILSGPNMAGKSTFIRSIGVNAVLAQCGAPVRATRLRLSPLAVAASICILDSLSGGISRFYAEIHRVKLISDLTEGPIPVLFLLDELLSGTNSHDRLAGTEFVVRSLMERNAIGIVSTHDLALARIPETMGAKATNCHFEDRFEDGKLIFDYKLKPGIVQTSNALDLMRSIGLGVNK